jgi:hypothetical protein
VPRVRAVAPRDSAATSGVSPAATASLPGGEPDAPAPLDVTAESGDDEVASLADRAARRAELILVAKRLKDQDRQADIDRIHAEFDANAAERAELLRQMNVLRDMAMEQLKHDDEILKKWITRI